MNELLYALIEERLASLESDYKSITGASVQDMNRKLTNLEIRSTLNSIQSEYLYQSIQKSYTPHKTLHHDVDPGDEQGVEL